MEDFGNLNTNKLELNSKFNEIKKKGWIEASSHGNGNVGITFENELGKERENLPIADYKGIEIKTNLQLKSRKYITLFSSNPDGKYIFQSRILMEKYGNYDKTFINQKNFYARVNSKTYKYINGYYMKLNVNYKKEKVILEIYDKKFNLIDNDCFWDFDTLEKKINTKLQNLAYVNAERKYQNNKVYFKYTEIKFYKLINFENFIKLIRNGTIKICFKIGIYKKGKKIGTIYDHGTGFEIQKEDLEKLYIKQQNEF